jgi:branched-chain amino acid transport system permease protein
MRATTQNRTVASLMGVNTNWIIGFVFGISSIIAGVAGALSSSVFFITLDMGVMFGTKAFASNVIGGFGSPAGAVVGGLLIGVFETFGASLISSQYKDLITFTILLLFLLFRPKGIFKLEVSEKV